MFTARGAGGGIELMDGFRTNLTGLTDDEARCLFLVGQPQVAHRLGLAAPTRTARNKLLERDRARTRRGRRPGCRRGSFTTLTPGPATGYRTASSAGSPRSVQQHRQVEITIADEPAVTVRPLGLVLKAGSWQLVVTAGDALDAVDGDLHRPAARGPRLTNRRFTPPPDFDLTSFWQERATRARRGERQSCGRRCTFVQPAASTSTASSHLPVSAFARGGARRPTWSRAPTRVP